MKTDIIIFLIFLTAVTTSARAVTLAVDTGKVGTGADPKDPPLIFSGSVDTYWKYGYHIQNLYGVLCSATQFLIAAVYAF